MLNKPSRLTRGGPPVWVLEESLTTPRGKARYEISHRLSDLGRHFAINCRRMRWGGLVARIGWWRIINGVRWRNLKEKGPLEDPDIEGKVVLKLICMNQDGKTCCSA